MTIEVLLSVETEHTTLPHPSELKRWVEEALGNSFTDASLSVKIVDNDEIQELNEQWRGKDKPTNVLSFPATLPEIPGQPRLIGDLVIAAPYVHDEAASQHKNFIDHFAHMVVHGCLHLCGYDHEEDEEARIMEQKEQEIMEALGFPNPYNEDLNE